MLYHNVKIMGTYLRFFDAGIAATVSFSSMVVIPEFIVNMTPIPANQAAFFSLLMFFSFLLVSFRLNTYHERRTERIFNEILSLAENTLFALSLSLIVSVVAGNIKLSFTLSFALLFVLGSMLFLRVLVRIVIRYLRKQGKDYRNWVLIGDNQRSNDIARSVAMNPHFGVRILDIYDLAQSEDSSQSKDGLTKHLDNVLELKQILAQNVVDEVIVSLPLRSYYDEIRTIIDICHDAGISIKVPTDPFSRQNISSTIDDSGGISVVTQYTGPDKIHMLAIKRLFDVCSSFFGLLLLSPLFLIIAILVKVDSKGPILYKSVRVGLHGRKFMMIKFRTMIVGADKEQDELRAQSESGSLAFKIKNDPRVTRVGKYLRQLHIDELPQLWNVLKGDMSVVGPRPLPIDEAAGEQWWHRRRLSMPPGLTCYWQITGDHKMPFDEWAQLDLKYIDQWSLWLDMKLVFATVLIMFRRQGW